MTINLTKITQAITLKCQPISAQSSLSIPMYRMQPIKDVFESEDSKLLSRIKDNIMKLRNNSTKGKILLSYGHYVDCDIPYQKSNFYRAMGKTGYADFLRTGLLRANPDGKYSSVYFDVGTASKKYAQGRAGEYIAETGSNKIRKVNGFYGADFIDSAKDKIRIWKRIPNTKKYEIVFDTMDDIISRHPSFRV